MTNSSPWYRWPIEIDSLPINKCDFPWQTVGHNQRVPTTLKLDAGLHAAPAPGGLLYDRWRNHQYRH